MKSNINKRIIKPDLVKELSKRTGFSQARCSYFISEFTHMVMDLVEENHDVQIKGFGTFKTTYLKGRKGRDPNTGEQIHISGRKRPVFRPGTSFVRRIRTAKGKTK